MGREPRDERRWIWHAVLAEGDALQPEGRALENVGEKAGEGDGGEIAHVVEGHCECESEGRGMGRERRADKRLDEVGDFLLGRKKGDALIDRMVIAIRQVECMIECMT